MGTCPTPTPRTRSPVTPVARTHPVGDLTRHTQSILERAQAPRRRYASRDRARPGRCARRGRPPARGGAAPATRRRRSHAEAQPRPGRARARRTPARPSRWSRTQPSRRPCSPQPPPAPARRRSPRPRRGRGPARQRARTAPRLCEPAPRLTTTPPCSGMPRTRRARRRLRCGRREDGCPLRRPRRAGEGRPRGPPRGQTARRGRELRRQDAQVEAERTHGAAALRQQEAAAQADRLRGAGAGRRPGSGWTGPTPRPARS